MNMHRQIMSAQKGTMIDHKNHNGLDNRKENLRFCTNAQNIINTIKPCSNKNKYRGIEFDKNKNRYRASTHFNKKRVRSKWYRNAIDAAKTYDELVKKYYGEFARLNFPNE